MTEEQRRQRWLPAHAASGKALRDAVDRANADDTPENRAEALRALRADLDLGRRAIQDIYMGGA